MQDATLSVYPDAVVVPSLLFGATDTRHYAGMVDNTYRYHGMILASKQAKSVHGTDEYISVESFEKSIDIAKAITQQL